MIKIPHLFVLGLVSASLVGCSGGFDSNAEDFVKEVQRNKGMPLPEVTEEIKLGYLPYTAMELRSPFQVLDGIVVDKNALKELENQEQLIQLVVEEESPDAGRPREYLESFPLDTISMVGTLTRQKQIWALVTDGDGLIHQVQIGDFMGPNSGEVVEITEDTIHLVELVKQQSGWQQRASTVKLTD